MRIGFTCAARNGFHLHADLTHLRIADANGQDVPTGTPGDIVISNLTNRGTVLLNYRLGDQGQLAEQPCTCGRTFPRLALISGRSDDAAILPNGEYLHSTAIWQVIKEGAEFLQYQIVQQTPEHFDLRLTTVDEATFERIYAGLLDRIRPLTGPEVTLTASYVSPDAPFGSAKRRRLVPYSHPPKA
jgi:phenylacetate-CoA ligase